VGVKRANTSPRIPLARIAGLKRKMTAFRTSFAIEELEIQLQDGQTLAIVFKDLTWQALEGQARQVKPRLLYSPLREIETYRSILHLHHFRCQLLRGRRERSIDPREFADPMCWLESRLLARRYA
jgi:hypothetical protein